MKIYHWSLSDIGLVREVNQDRWGHTHCHWGDLFVLADGLGHREGGQFASQTTVDLIKKSFSQSKPEAISEFLASTMQEVNDVIHRKKSSEYNGAMMGSTCAVLVGQLPQVWVAHVGDSRVYYLHDGELSQLTKDHSLVQQMVDEGILSGDQAAVHPRRNIVTKAMGSEVNVNPEVREEPIEVSPGDRFLLCSDGLWGLVSFDDLRKILGSQEAPTAAKMLIDLARKNGGYDNITVQVVHIVD